MSMNTDNKDVFFGNRLINQTMFVCNSPAPKTFVLMFETFGFTKSFERVFVDILDQFKNFFNKTRFAFGPVCEIFDYLREKIVLFIPVRYALQTVQSCLH